MKSAKYTFKVWLFSATVSPLIAFILQFYYYHGWSNELGWLKVYPIIVFFELVLTSLLWVMFWLITLILYNMISDRTLLRTCVSLTGLTIAAATCWFVSDAQFSLSGAFFTTALSNCLCIFRGCWIFDMG